MESIFIQFNFKPTNSTNDTLQFYKPNKIFSTDKVEEVKPILAALELEHRAGKYLAGYMSYEAAQAFEPNYRTNKNLKMPLIWFASFDQPVKQMNHLPNKKYRLSNWESVMAESEYNADIASIKYAIEQGKTSQVNYTTRLRSQFTGDSFSFYQQLLANQQADYSAYLDIGRFKILSASPELFFQINQDNITTKPMKGTIKRGKTLAEDEANKQYLLDSDKERAENLMIVDVLKNDLRKLAVPGTVKVPEQLAIETYPTLHQMTSTVTAKLKEDSQIIDWFTALFPCGSITGTPRLNTMNLIEQLETTPREVYCGAIGYITPEREVIFNVPIRTVVIDDQEKQATYGVGGGITAGSVAQQEYQETQTKAAFLTKKNDPFSLIESLQLTNGYYPYLTYHLKRLRESTEYFGYSLDEKAISDQLLSYAKEHSIGDYKVRLLLNATGDAELSAEKIQRPNKVVTSYLAKEPIDKDNRYLYHKTTLRDHYEELAIDEPNNFSTLLWNEEAELTEFTIGNLVLKVDGHYLTPPVESGLLPGTFRQHLLDQKKITEHILMKKDLARADEIWLINAVRGWVKVEKVL